MHIILIEDNQSLAKSIASVLRDQGHAVDHLDDGLEACAFLMGQEADVAVIDVNLPRLSGIEIIRQLRAAGKAIPILVLTARGKTSERVEGLNAGADDYLVKPFEMAELIARLGALARRMPQVAAPQEKLGQLVYDRARRALSHAGREIDLPRRELALFEILLAHRGRLLEKDRIHDALYGTGAEVDANAVELLISRLRRKLDGCDVAIRTARGLGYMMDDA